ncbi:MAG: erythronate-4-phosphate dehydrogenase, partial [Bacteroidaceae bacterium]|nr:erythronate-4-phosphate dehydrogenase [Bacteroidaceae bacterium]
NCPGCNASSVGQYIHSAMLVLKRELGLDFQHTTVGIVGVGHVGTDVHRKLASLGINCLLCDPPRAEKEGNADGRFHSLQELKERCQVITFHTPLVTEGPWPTFHLADATFFDGLRQCPVIINTSRGEVVDNHALLDALEKGLVRQTIIDTWEGEPRINLSLLEKAFIGTPHIAGYSADGKANATQMVLTALCEWMGVPANFHVAPPSLPDTFTASADPEELALQLYNPREDSARLKACPDDFERLRNDYPLRRESVH